MYKILIHEHLQVIAQSWNTWYTNYLEQKRLRSLLLLVTRHWTNRAITQAWNTWYFNRVEQKRLRRTLAKVALSWKNRVSYHVHFMHQYIGTYRF